MKHNTFLFKQQKAKNTMKKMLILLILLSMTACHEFTLQKTHIQQGNFISPKEVNQLRRGMTKKQVANIMGSPVYDTTFNLDRWVYVYTSHIGKTRTSRRAIVTFQQNRLVDVKQS